MNPLRNRKRRRAFRIGVPFRKADTHLKQPSIRAIHDLCIETMAGVIWIAATIYVYVADVLQREEAWWGYINASFFLGLMLGGLFGMRGAGLIDRNIRKFVICSSFGISIMTFGFD